MYHTVLFIIGCFCLHSQKISAQQPGIKDFNLVSEKSVIKDTTVLVQGIFVKMRLLLPEVTQKNKKVPVIYIINTDSAYVLNQELCESLSTAAQKEYPAAIIIELKNFGKGFADAEITEIAPYILYTKKYIDKQYLTITEPSTSIITGYRQCAPVAVQLTLNHPDIFGRSGVFLGDFSLFPDFDEWLRDNADKMNGMMFLHSLDKDRSGNGKILNDLMDQVGSHSKGLLYNFLDNFSEKQINTNASFIEFYKWILSNGHNYIIHAQEKIKIRS